MVVSTYQAASGAGQAAMDELELQTKEVLEGKEVTKNIFPFQVLSPTPFVMQTRSHVALACTSLEGKKVTKNVPLSGVVTHSFHHANQMTCSLGLYLLGRQESHQKRLPLPGVVTPFFWPCEPV